MTIQFQRDVTFAVMLPALPLAAYISNGVWLTVFVTAIVVVIVARTSSINRFWKSNISYRRFMSVILTADVIVCALNAVSDNSFKGLIVALMVVQLPWAYRVIYVLQQQHKSPESSETVE